MIGRRVVVTGTCLLALAGGLAGCGGEDSAVCNDMDALRASIEDVRDIDLGNDTLSTLSGEIQDIEADFDQLADDASDELSDELDAVEEAAAPLRTSIDAATADPTAESLAQVATDVQAFAAAIGDLGDAVSGTCD